MSDLISRQATIDAINALHDKPNAWLDFAVDAVMALPPAQPDAVTASLEELINDYGEDGFFLSLMESIIRQMNCLTNSKPTLL